MTNTDSKKCYFCDKTEGLKSIWLDDEANKVDNFNKLPERSCCINCFNDPDHGMEDSPIGSTDWYSTDYDWKPISRNTLQPKVTNGD